MSFKYREGVRRPINLPLDSSSAAITVGTVIKVGTAGYFQDAGAGDNPIGVAMQDVAAPSADGGAYCLVDVSEDSVYETTAGTGTITAAMAQQRCDLAASSTLDVTASTDDYVLIQRVDVAGALAFVSLRPTHAGVV